MTTPAAKVPDRRDDHHDPLRKVAQERYYDVLMQPGILMVKVHQCRSRYY